MTIKVTYHQAKGAAIQHQVQVNAAKAKIISLPEKSGWLEFVDTQTGVAPNKIITKRQGYDLQVYFDEKAEGEADLIITDYYKDELVPLLGMDSQQVYHAYVAELAESGLSVQQLADGVIGVQVLSTEAFSLTSTFPWWHIGTTLGGLGALALVAGRSNGTEGGGEDSGAKPEKVIFDAKNKGDGSVSFDLPKIPNNIKTVDVTYTPTNSDKPVVGKIEKDPATGKYVSKDPNIKVDPISGKVSIPEGKIKDGTEISVVTTNDKGVPSEVVKGTAGKDYTADTELTSKAVAKLIDKSTKADNNPEELIVTGKSEPNAEITIKDKAGNVVGKGQADSKGDFSIKVTEKDNTPANDIKEDSELTVISKVAGKNPTEETITVPSANEVPIEHVGDSVGPKNPPQTNIDPKTGDLEIPFPTDGETNKVNVDLTPKGETGQETLEVSKTENELNIKYQPNEGNPVNIDRITDPKTGGSSTDVSFTPTNPTNQTPISINVEKDGKGNQTTTIELTPEGQDKPLNIEVTQGQDGNVDVKIKNENGEVVGGKDDLPSNVKIDPNGNILIDTDGNNDTAPDTKINKDGSIEIPPGITVTDKGQVEIDNDGNKDTPPVVVKDNGDIKVPAGSTEPNTEIKVSGEDLAGKTTEATPIVATEPASPNPQGGTPLAPQLVSNKDGSVTATLPTVDDKGTPIENGSKVVLIFNKEPTGEETKVTLVKKDNGWEVDSSDPTNVTNATGVTIDNAAGTATINPETLQDGSTVKAYSQGPNDNDTQKSSTAQAPVAATTATDLDVSKVSMTSHNDNQPAKLGDITELKLTGTAGATEAGAKLEVKLGEQVIAEGTANADGSFTLTFREPDGQTINSGDKLTLVATAPNKKASDNKEVEVPEIANDRTGYKNDDIAPEIPTVVVGGNGDDSIKITPKNPQAGDVISVKVTDNAGQEHTLLVKVDDKGQLVADPSNNHNLAVTIKDGVIELDKKQIKDDSNLVVTVKDIAGNSTESNPVIENTGFDEVTANPTIKSIVAHDKDLSSNKNPEEFTITGTAPANSKVIAKDNQGNIIGETTAGPDGSYTLIARENGSDIKAGDTIIVVAQEEGKGESAVPASTTVGEATTHDRDKTPPKPAEILPPSDNGDVVVNLPENSQVGDQVEITLGKDTNGDGKVDQVTGKVTLEKQEDGWKPLNNPNLVTVSKDNDFVTIPSAQVPSGTAINVVSKDVAGNTTPTEAKIDNKLEQTKAPTDIQVVSKDEDNPSDGQPDSMRVTGKAEANAEVTVFLNGKEYSGKADSNGNFSIQVAAEDLQVGDNFSVKAQAENKTQSPETTTGADNKPLAVPNATEFADNVGPEPATIGEKTPEGNIPVNLDPNAQVGDQYVITVGKDTNNNNKLDEGDKPKQVVVEKTEDGWKVVEGGDTGLITDPITGNTALIPSGMVTEEGTKINVKGKDKTNSANNSSEVETTAGQATPTETTNGQTDKPEISELKAIDMDAAGDSNPERVLVKGTTTLPNTVVTIKDSEGNVIGKGKSSATANKDGTYDFEIEATELKGKDLTNGEKLIITAKAEGKSESPEATAQGGGDIIVPAVENNASGHPQDTTKPTAPEVAQKLGSTDAVVFLPKDAKVGDQVSISKDLNGDQVIGENEVTTLEKGENGQWTVKGDNPLNVNIDNANTTGEVTVPNNNQGDKILVESKDLAGNTSLSDSVTIAAAKLQSTKPTDIEIKAIDTSSDNTAEEIKVKGKVVGAEKGTKVLVLDEHGNELGEGTVTGDNGEFEFNVPAGGLQTGAILEIKALEKGKEISEAGTPKGDDSSAKTTLPEVEKNEEGHPNDTTGPSAPELIALPNSGAVAVMLPTDANAGDQVEVKFTDEAGNEQTVILTKQADDTWESSNEELIPHVKEKLDQPKVVIPENSLKDGQPVSAKSKDGFVDGRDQEAKPIKAGTDAKTAAPTELKVVATDKNPQADSDLDSITVSGKAEANSLVVIYKGDQEIGRVQLANGDTSFSLEILESTDTGTIIGGDPIKVVAKVEGKEVSDPATSQVPAELTYVDATAPEAPTVQASNEPGNGSVTVSIPQSPAEPFVRGDQLVIEYFDEANPNQKQTATLTYDGKGNWNSDKAEIPSIKKGATSTVIPENLLADKANPTVTAYFKDNAGNKSTTPATAIAGYDDVSATPTVDSIVGTDTDNDGKPDTVVIKGKLLRDGLPVVGADVTVSKDGTPVGTPVKTNDKGEYEITLTEGQNNVGTEINPNDVFKVSAKEADKEVSATVDAVVPKITTLRDVSLVAIDLDTSSNETPEQFVISGTAEQGATVQAVITVGDKEVVIGEVTVNAENGQFTLTTEALATLKQKDEYKELLKDFTYKYDKPSTNDVTETATSIRLVATKAGQSPSTAVSKDATHVQGGQGDSEPNRHPNDKTAITEQNAAKPTALPDGFGGAKIELPPTEGETYLVVTVKYPQAGDGAESSLTLTWDGQNWTAAPTDVVTITEKDGKFVARLPADKVSAVTNDQPNSIKVITEDYAGNKFESTVPLNKPAGDTIENRTDTPTIKAGSETDAGDIVATPGADNTKMVVTYVDQESGQEKTITVVKDMDAAEWKVEGDKPATVIVDPATGKITVPADLAKDGEEARAVGFKGDNDDPLGSEKPYSQPYTHADGTSGTFEVVDEVKITVNASDKTVTEADEPSVTPLNDKFAGAATVKGGADNVKVEMVVTGYVDASGQIVTKEHAATQTGSSEPTTKELILFAVKDPKTGEWTVVGTTKDKYNQAPDNEKEAVLSPISNDIATVTKDGTITLKANALQDNSAVKAKGYDALGNTNPTGSEYKSQNVGADPENKDVDADEPYVPVTGGDGSMTAKPGEDNTSMKVTFTKDNQKNTLEIEKDSNGKWKVKDGSTITANGEASVEDGQITLSNGAKLNPNTGEVYFPAGTVDFDSEFTAVGTNKDGYESESVSKPVLEDPTPVAEAPIAVVEGNKVVVTPGADSKSITLKGTNVGTDPVIEKDSNGQWKLKGEPISGIDVDPATGKVVIDSSKIADGEGIVAEAKDGWKPEANNAQSNGGTGVRPVILDNDATSTEAPTIQTHASGEKQGSVDITPKSDHNSVTVDYKDEQDRPQSITATRNPETGEWSLQPIVTTDEQGKTVVTPVPASKATIDPSTGVISLKADELKDGENITATGRDVNGNSKSTEASDATKAPNDPEGTKLPENEQPTDVPEVVDNPTPPQAETPTLFENVGVGHVRIKPGDGVDYISFNVAIDVRSEGTYQGSPASFINYVLIKNDSGAWEKYAYKITDRNGNGSIDPEDHDSFEDVKNSPNAQALEMISWDESSKSFNLKTKEGVSAPSGQNPNDTYIARLSSVLGDKSTGAGDKQNKIFDIMIGKEGGETVVALPPNGSNGNMTINDNGSSSATAIADFDLLGNNTYSSEAGDIRLIHNAPRYHHVLSNGDDLSAPVFKVTRVNSNGNMTTTLEANVDPDVKTLSFTANVIKDSSRNEVKTFNFIRGENNKWTFYTDPNYPEHDSYAHKAMLITEDGQPNKFIIKSGNGWKFYVDDPSYGQYSGDDRNKYIENVKYGAKAKTGDEDSSISKFYGTSYNASDELIGTSIPLANIDLTQGETINITTPPSLPATPSEPAGQVEAVDTPTATAEGLGAVKVKPADTNSGAKYRVNYVDEATGQSKVINVKKTGNTWAFEQDGSTGSIDGQKISLNAQTGELTFAPEAVRDGGKVTITAYDSQGNARAQKDVVAGDEPITVNLIRDKASENIGGAKATPTTGTNKFKLTFTDEGNNINVSTPTKHSVVYEKVNGSWKVVEVDGKPGSTIKINGVTVDLNTQQNGYLTVNSSTGEVTIDRNSLKDGDPVSMIPYSKRGTESSGNAKTITTEKDKLTTALDDSSQKLGQLVGTDHGWAEVAIFGGGSYADGLAQLVHGKRYDKSDTNNAKATVTALTPEEDKATVSFGKGKRLSYSDNNDVVKIGNKVMNKYTWDPTLKFDFKNGDDILAVGHDLGYGSENYSGLKSEYEHRQKVADRHRVQVEMGAGNDILAVGFHDVDWDVLKDRNTGVIDIHKRSESIHGYEKVGFLNSNEWYGGQLAGAKVFMGEGNDTVILKGTAIDRNGQRASKNSIIDLGEGDNRLVLTPGETVGRAMSSTKVVAGSGNDVVKGDSFIENTDIRLGGGSDEFIARKVEYTLVDLGHGDDWAEVKGEIGNGAQILLGAGNDVFDMKAGLSPNNSKVDGGSGVDTLLISRDGAHITNHNIKGFENVGFKANNITFGIRADYFGLIEGPMKITKADNVRNAKVDLGMNNDLPSNAQGAQPGDKADGSYRWTKESMKVEGDTTYNVYKYVAGPYYVWIEDGITVI